MKSPSSLSKQTIDPSFKPRIALGLLHYPILDRTKQIVSTNITNFDIHDIARAARVYGVERYYLIHPIEQQLMFVERVLDHWRVGEGSKYNSSRSLALDPVRTASSLDKALKDWSPESSGGGAPLVVGTHARPVEGTRFFSVPDLRQELWENNSSVFLLFGTGFGMTDEYMRGLDGVLESIRSAPPDTFRHLSVRSAVSIYLDRLLGPW
jgi:hypothetical protein